MTLVGLIFVGIVIFGTSSTLAQEALPFPSQILCETEVDTDSKESTTACEQTVDPEFVAVLAAAYRQLPTLMQAEFRRFHRIYVRRNFGSGGAAEVFRAPTPDRYPFDPLFSLNLNLQLKSVGGLGDYDTNKLLHRFGEVHPKFLPTASDAIPLLIRYRSDGLDDRVFRLKYILVHEIGHAVDMRYSKRLLCNWKPDDTAECSANPESFAAISWDIVRKIGKTPEQISEEVRLLPTMRFVYINMFCFFYCEGKPSFLGPNDIPRIFSDFKVLPFPSLYALANDVEDFAETWTDYWLEREEGLYQQIVFNGEVLADSKLKRELPGYKRKLDYIANFVRKLEEAQKSAAEPKLQSKAF
jgi:hypothetical protein